MRLLLGSGRDAPDPREVGLERFPTTIDRGPCPRTRTTRSRPTGRRSSPPGRARSRATSSSSCSRRGTTGNPKGVMLAHANVLAGAMSFHGIINADGAPDRVVAPPLARAGAGRLAVLRDERRRGRPVRPEPQPARDLRLPSASTASRRMVLVPQVLDLFWSAIEREVEKQGRTATFNRLRGIARRLPYAARRLLFRSVHNQFGGGLRLFATAGAFLPPALQQAWEDMGVIVLQGYGATETCAGSATTMDDHPLGCVGWPPKPRRDADRRGRRDPVPRPQPVARATGTTPRRPPPRSPRTAGTSRATSASLRRQGSAAPPRPQEGHHRPAQRVQRVPRGPRERAARGRDPGLGRDRDAARADRGRRARARHARGPGDPRAAPAAGAGRAGGGEARDRCRGQGRQPEPRPEPADRRLARVAGGRLPAHAHASRSSGTGSAPGLAVNDPLPVRDSA